MNKQNLRSRATEIFEVINGISPLKVTELFNRNEGIIIIWEIPLNIVYQ